jgi:hypothetical protein
MTMAPVSIPMAVGRLVLTPSSAPERHGAATCGAAEIQITATGNPKQFPPARERDLVLKSCAALWGVELHASTDRGLALLASRPLSVAFGDFSE